MATAVRSSARGLSADELETIRDALAAGRRPKVMFTETAGQVAGQTGQVVRLTDPELSDEWVVVRFGRDELPFSPADLAIPTKSAAARRAEAAASRADATAAASRTPSAAVSPSPAPAPEFKIVREKPAPTPRQETTVPDAPTSTVETIAAPAPTENGKTPRKIIGKGPKAKAPAALTVTLAYTEGEWTVAAQQGAKALARPYLIRPSEALRMVGLLDAPGVQEAVQHILSSERAEAEHQAEKLRTELAEIEAKLAELRVAS